MYDGMSVVMEIHLKNLTPFKVTATDTNRSATYDFLLMIHNNHAFFSSYISG